MNKLKILISNNTYNLFRYSIKSISNFLDDLNYENIIIVPDKLSLQTEQSIFEELNIEAYFNLTVMGISKFANTIFQKNNLDYLQCSALESKLLTMQAIQNVCDNFKCFSKKYTLGFVDEIFAKIEQIKSSNCDIDSLYDQNGSIGTKLKFEDLKLIYKEYENLRGGKLDSGALLSIANNLCLESDFLKRCNVFFVGFDSLTKQGLELLKNVAKVANFTQVSIVAPKSQKNFKLYDQTFLDFVLSTLKEEKIECETEWLNLPFKNHSQNLTLENLFTRNKFGKTDYFKICRANSTREEIELCSKQINYMLKTKDLKFNDFAICCNPSYHKLLQSTLQNLNIDTYCDCEYPLLDLEPVKFLFEYFSFVTTKDDEHLHSIVTNNFFDLPKEKSYEILSLISKYGTLKNILKFYKCDDEEIENCLNDLNLSIKEENKNYLEILKKIIKKFNLIEKINKLSEIFEKNGDILLNKIYLQIENKLENCFETLLKLNNLDSITLDNFTALFKKILMETTIKHVPATTNQVFIGDTKSFYFNKKYVFVLGLNEGEMPVVLNDYGIISDKEINSETIKAKLEPTTKIINKRNKFKLFEILISSVESCFIYYHSLDSENKPALKSEFVSEIEELFELSEISAAKLKIILNDSESDIKKLCYNLQDEYNANLSLRENHLAKIQGLITFALLKNNGLYSKLKVNQNASDFSKLFFKNNKASISIIEKYNACPKAAFLANGLKLKPIKKNKVEANIIGTFLHEVAEKFVKFNINKLGELTIDEVSKSVEFIISEMKEKEDYYSLNLPENKYLFELIKKESERFCNFLNYEQSVSSFKPEYEEKYFGNGEGFKPIYIDVDGEKYYISGFVDRIDVCDDNFRIIDYKTGNTTNASGMEHLFYGTKIQLFVYAKAIENNLNKNLFGAFYLPIKNSFSKDGTLYQLSGFFEDSVSMVIKCDKNFGIDNPKSNLINVTLAKPKDDGELNLRKKQNILTKENLNCCMEYAIEIVKQSIKDIKEGFIGCSPIGGKCSNCEFNILCSSAFDESIERDENYNVNKEKFMEIDYGKRAN